LTRRARPLRAALAAALLSAGGCAHFNTLYNAELKYDQAMEIKRKADPEREKISAQEEQLYKEAFERAARVVKYWPQSKWVDDALLLMGRASFEKGDYSTALRKFDEILVLYPNSKLVSEALLMKGRTLYGTKDYPAAVDALNRAAELGGGKWRADVLHHLGLVREQEADVEGALAAFSEVVEKHEKSEWYGLSALEAGDLERDRGDLAAAVGYYEKVRRGGRTAEERYVGGMRKGDALLKSGELARARTTYADVAKRAANDERRGKALLAEAGAVAAAGDRKGAVALYGAIVSDYARQETAAEAQFQIAALRDAAGDLEGAKEQYELVKEQGTGHESWQRASERIVEIEKVLSLREKVAAGGAERDSSRFLLAEQLLEKLDDVDGALAEYAALSDEAKGSEWGAKALFAQAWVLENRLDRRAAADSVLFRLANAYAGTDVDAFARKRLGYPVWKVERVAPPKVVFIRAEGEGAAAAEVMVQRVEPKSVPLPEGVSSVEVWVRVRLAHDGAVEETKVVKSGGEAFDEACVEAARASRFVGPDDGGPEFTVLEYRFPPPAASTSTPGGAPDGAAQAGSPEAVPPNASQAPAPFSTPSAVPTPPASAPRDSVAPGPPATDESTPVIRDRRLDRNP
jgi:TolA-binding protein